MRIKKVAAATLGCKVNQYDTEAILCKFKQSGYEIVGFDDMADIYIINTCTVTNTGDKKSRQMIRRARSKNKNAIIVATGCYSQLAPEEVAGIAGVNIVTGTRDRDRIVKLIDEYYTEHGVGVADQWNSDSLGLEKPAVMAIGDGNNCEKYENTEIVGGLERTRAYIKVQDGCDQYCSYCAVPYARGRARSRMPVDVTEEAQRLAADGYKEIVIAGIHVASYGKDIGYSDGLVGLLKAAHEINRIERIRLSSIDPCYVDERFAEAVRQLPKLCDHFHLSLQSGCDKTLKAMNRRYTTSEYMNAVELLRSVRPDASLTTDIITGFPGESEADFNRSLEFVSIFKPAMLHVFPYSPKKGTAAYDYPEQVPKAVKHRRADLMIELGKQLSKEFQSKFVNRTMDVLMESRVSENIYQGYTSNYIRIVFNSAENVTGRIVPVMIRTSNMPDGGNL